MRAGNRQLRASNPGTAYLVHDDWCTLAGTGQVPGKKEQVKY